MKAKLFKEWAGTYQFEESKVELVRQYRLHDILRRAAREALNGALYVDVWYELQFDIQTEKVINGDVVDYLRKVCKFCVDYNQVPNTNKIHWFVYWGPMEEERD